MLDTELDFPFAPTKKWKPLEPSKRSISTSESTPPQTQQDQLVFLNRPPEYLRSADFLVNKTHSKLLSKATGPYKIISVLLENITIDKYGVNNTASIDFATTDCKIFQIKVASEESRAKEKPQPPSTHPPICKDGTANIIYLVDKAVRHVGSATFFHMSSVGMDTNRLTTPTSNPAKSLNASLFHIGVAEIEIAIIGLHSRKMKDWCKEKRENCSSNWSNRMPQTKISSTTQLIFEK